MPNTTRRTAFRGFSELLAAVAAVLSAFTLQAVTLGPGHVLVQGKTLAGLTDATLVHDMGGDREVKLVRTGNALVLRVVPKGMTVIIK